MPHRLSDHHRHRLALPDVRALLRLCNDLHATAAAAVAHASRGGAAVDPDGNGEVARPKRLLLEGVRALTRAEQASAALATFTGTGARGALTIVWSAHTGDAAGEGP